MDGVYYIGNLPFCERCDKQLRAADCRSCEGVGYEELDGDWEDEDPDDCGIVFCSDCEGSGIDENGYWQCWSCNRRWTAEQLSEMETT